MEVIPVSRLNELIKAVIFDRAPAGELTEQEQEIFDSIKRTRAANPDSVLMLLDD